MKNGREKSAEKSGEKKGVKKRSGNRSQKIKSEIRGQPRRREKTQIAKICRREIRTRKQKAEIPEDTKRVKTA